jgi:sugar lactone lactonase YvrE
VERVGDLELTWGESVRWDDRRNRLYLVDCAAQTLHWLEGGEPPVHTVPMPSMPAGVALTEGDELVVCLDDGLHVVDPDDGTWTRLSPYPEGLGARANDLCADLDGNLVTGTLNLGPAPGSAWWFSPTEGWRRLDDDISNTNGPAVAVLDGAMTLIVGDTSAHYFSYPYDPSTGTVGPRSIFGDVSDLEGGPDGSTVDADGGLWCALFGGSQLARFTTEGLDATVPLPIANPTDVAFGGPDLDRLYIVSVSGDAELDGALLVRDDLGTGRVEPRARLATA